MSYDVYIKYPDYDKKLINVEKEKEDNIFITFISISNNRRFTINKKYIMEMRER